MQTEDDGDQNLVPDPEAMPSADGRSGVQRDVLDDHDARRRLRANAGVEEDAELVHDPRGSRGCST